MPLLNTKSLAQTIDNVNDVLFFGAKISRSDADSVSTFIASRLGLPAGYEGLFAPTAADRKAQLYLFSGEKIKSAASGSAIMGLESLRILKLLNSGKAEPREALKDGLARFSEQRRKSEELGYTSATFCCGICTTAYWRNLVVNGAPADRARLTKGMDILKTQRLGNGRWKRFPFYQTALVLTEIGAREAVEELRYTATVFERFLRRAAGPDAFHKRRIGIGARVLAMV